MFFWETKTTMTSTDSPTSLTIESTRQRSGSDASTRPVLAEFKPALKLKPHRSLKPIAFAAVVFSTVAVTACLISFPLVFHYVQTLQASVQGEVEYCKLRSRDMWRQMMDVSLAENNDHDDNDEADDVYEDADFELELSEMQRTTTPNSLLLSWNQATASRRPKRSTNDGLCCTCQQGPPGPDGPPGQPGKDGVPGEGPGAPGAPGPDAELHDKVLPVPPQCPCQAPRGPLGSPGPPGNDGQPGSAGKNGEDGRNGPPGPTGPPGAPGQPGAAGQRGPLGEPGVLVPGEKPPSGPPGQAGRPGPVGPPGRPGQPGNDGEDGKPGETGESGQRGPPGPNGSPGVTGSGGEPGAPGSCEHCPPARLAPGY